MKRVKLDNVYESPIPPSDTKVLWADRDKKTGDLRAIHRYGKNGWEPYLVSVAYLLDEGSSTLKESAGIQ